MANDASTNPEVAERIANEKRKLIDALKEMPIIVAACKRGGASTATYYRWRSEDKRFRRESEDALEQGCLYINDMSESQLIGLIKEKKMPAIALWLRHHHPRYGSQARPYVPIAEAEDLTDGERQVVLEALALASGLPVKKAKRSDGDHARIS
jgi:hypothetical protein